MPTEEAYRKLIDLCAEINKLGLNGWETDLSITDKKFKTDFKVKIKLNKKKIKK